MPEVSREQEWIGVDLDGTLATFHEEEYFGKYGPETIGEPVPEMIERVKRWIEAGGRVKIFTARVSPLTAKHLDTTPEAMEKAIHLWLINNLGYDLEVTHEKDFAMTELWDDINLMEVKRNTGLPVCTRMARFMMDKVQDPHSYTKQMLARNFSLRCEPAVPTDIRHKIEELLTSEGYDVYGAGEFTDGQSCDISFTEHAPPLKVNERP